MSCHAAWRIDASRDPSRRGCREIRRSSPPSVESRDASSARGSSRSGFAGRPGLPGRRGKPQPPTAQRNRRARLTAAGGVALPRACTPATCAAHAIPQRQRSLVSAQASRARACRIEPRAAASHAGPGVICAIRRGRSAVGPRCGRQVSSRSWGGAAMLRARQLRGCSQGSPYCDRTPFPKMSSCMKRMKKPTIAARPFSVSAKSLNPIFVLPLYLYPSSYTGSGRDSSSMGSLHRPDGSRALTAGHRPATCRAGALAGSTNADVHEAKSSSSDAVVIIPRSSVQSGGRFPGNLRISEIDSHVCRHSSEVRPYSMAVHDSKNLDQIPWQI